MLSSVWITSAKFSTVKPKRVDSGIDLGAVIWMRINLDHYVTSPACVMNRPFPMLLLGQCDAESLVE